MNVLTTANDIPRERDSSGLADVALLGRHLDLVISIISRLA